MTLIRLITVMMTHAFDAETPIEETLGALDDAWRAFAAVEQIAQESCSPPSAIALAWLLAQPGVTAPILGARCVPQLEACLDALKVTLTPEQLARLDVASAWETGG